MYPRTLLPVAKETLIIDGAEITVPKSEIYFNEWHGTSLENTFGDKPQVNFEGRPMFAELAIMNMAINDGWDARWVETYGAAAEPYLLVDWIDAKIGEQPTKPIDEDRVNDRLKSIHELNDNSYSGCWDILAWKDDLILMMESKRRSRDAIHDTQLAWLRAAIKSGHDPRGFLLVEWDFRYVGVKGKNDSQEMF